MNNIPYKGFTQLLRRFDEGYTKIEIGPFIIKKSQGSYDLYHQHADFNSDVDPILSTWYPRTLHCFIFNIPYSERQ